MLLLILLALAFGAVAADTIRYRRLRRRGASRLRLHTMAAWAAATDALPLVVALAGWLLPDNDTPWMTFSMWAFWVWIATVVPRLAFYAFSAVRLPRVGIAAALALTGLFIWGATAGRTRIHVERVTVCSDRLPAAFDGFRIAQLSDIHLGSVVRPGRELRRIVDSVNALRPDLVVFTGDLVNVRYTELDTTAMRILGGFRAPVLSVTGNHDVGAYIKDTVSLPREVSLRRLLERQRAMGWQVLQDTTLLLGRAGDTIAVSGIAFDPALRHKRHDRALPPAHIDATYAAVPDSLFNLTLVHLPQLWEQVTAAGRGDLTLSGHVHAMQMKFRLFGREYSPARLLYERWSGRYDDAGSTLYINDGTGCVAYPMRLGAYPQITLFTLRRCE